MDERGAAGGSLRVPTDVQVLLDELQDRQRLLERLYRIQRAIARRDPLDQVLDDICLGAADLLGDVIVGVRLVDRRRPTVAPLVAWTGLDAPVPDDVRERPTDSGVSGRAMREQRLVVAEDYGAHDAHDPWYVELGLASAMAAPVARDNEVVGALVVSSTRARRFTPLEQETLLTMSEHVSLALNDASALRAMAEALDDALHQATHDPLTGLPNRTLVLDRLSEAIARPPRRGREVAVLFLDLDRFKRINDLFGHRHGDALLVTVADRLRSTLRADDVVGRLGGDEFIVVAQDLDDAELDVLVDRIGDAVSAPVQLERREATLTASIGVARARRGTSGVEVLGDADVALHRAKDEGRARSAHFDQSMRTRMVARSETEQALRRAVRDQELRVHYQPAVHTPTPRAVAVEALVRWERPGFGLVGPADFLPVAEETGQIREMGAWILGQACAQVAQWRTHPLLDHLLVSVNVSPRQLTDPCFAGTVADVLARTGLPADALWLEMTEHVFLDEDEDTLTNVLALRAQGVHLVIDDFGTGYSSLAYLKRFPVEAIKIDQSFVAGLETDRGDQAIVTAIIRLAEALELGVVAEGIERPEQAQALEALGCHLGQGLLYGAAASPDETFERLLTIGR
jgi:diguanylate cyclase (GGDEF)-like protein